VCTVAVAHDTIAAGGAWYVGEAAQLHQRRSARAGDRRQVALARDDRVIGLVKTVRLRRG
jgi:hypothetical protein